MFQMMVNRAKFDALPNDLQRIIRIARHAMHEDMKMDYDLGSGRTMEVLRTQHGVRFLRLNNEVLTGLGNAAGDMVRELLESDDEYMRRVMRSYLARPREHDALPEVQRAGVPQRADAQHPLAVDHVLTHEAIRRQGGRVRKGAALSRPPARRAGRAPRRLPRACRDGCPPNWARSPISPSTSGTFGSAAGGGTTIAPAGWRKSSFGRQVALCGMAKTRNSTTSWMVTKGTTPR